MITFEEILYWLREKSPERLNELWRRADRTRQEQVGDAVHLRGLVELSNHCRRNCLYCGIRVSHKTVSRYRLTLEEVLECAKKAADFHYGTLVIQAGEDLKFDEAFITEMIREIKARYPLAITLSLGERSESEWIRWHEAGANRYLLRFETSNNLLFRAIHPVSPDSGGRFGDRIAMLRTLREIGYEIGSGVMIGIPGQSVTDLACDIDLFRQLDLDMIGCGPFLPHPETPLGNLRQDGNEWVSRILDQNGLPAFRFPVAEEPVTGTNEMTFKVYALTRLVCPQANIPSTTAVVTLGGKEGRLNGLCRGANVIMPNLTPTKYRMLYEIYPDKAASFESAEETHQKALENIRAIGRFPGSGPGGRVRGDQKEEIPKI